MKGQSRLIPNYYSIKKYNDNLYKLVVHKYPVRNSGFEEEKEGLVPLSEKKSSGEVNEEKLRNHLSRARSKVFDYAMTNSFDYFVTLTLDGSKYDRYNLKAYIKDLGQFIRDYRKKWGLDTQYILIPEQHKNGAWHMHGLIRGLSEEDLVVNQHGYLDWLSYSKKFGYISIAPIRNKEAVSKYITKYITKTLDTGGGVTERNKKLYYVTRGLKLPKKIKHGSMTTQALSVIKDFDYTNDYVSSLMIDKQVYDYLSTLL